MFVKTLDLSGSEKHFSHLKGAEVRYACFQWDCTCCFTDTDTFAAVQACKTGPNNCTGTCSVDFWQTEAPATGFDGVYSAEVYGSETVKIIDEAAAAAVAVHPSDVHGAKPFFVYLAFADTHEPLEAPQRFQDLYPPTMQCKSRMMLGAMVSAMDEAVGNITAALKRTKLWDNTLLVWAADNGGPTGVGQIGPKAATCAANNYPLYVSIAPAVLLCSCARHSTHI